MTSGSLVILTGRVVRTPRRHCRPDGLPVLQFPFRISGPGRNDPVTVVAIGKPAETHPDLFQTGQGLRVKGAFKQRQWQSPEGRQRSRLELIATDIERWEDPQPNPVIHQRGEEENDHEKTIG